ncbi:hypothetical protein IV203_013306 [Nitzschia inconspicua]|uniref:RING-type domain-containing protein n=1 Tax=Nitzschia inconspicua TaxID=303405 RepID=A0A9K3M6T8_9STRA|nr:hypothetical protein IV203_013306 [Nitzschia inconspicua]
MTSSVSTAAASGPNLTPEIIELLDSDDERTSAAARLKISSSASPIDVDLIDLTSPVNGYSLQHHATTRPQPEVVDLIEMKPTARKAPNGDLDRKMSAKKRPRHSASVSDDFEILDSINNHGSQKPPPVAAMPGILDVSESKELSPLVRVLEVLPDVAVVHVKKLLAKHNGDPETVVSVILSDENYPKQKSAESGTGKTALAGAPFIRRSSSVVVERLRKEPKYDYSSPNSFQPTLEYIEEAIQQLVYDFPFIKMDTITYIFKQRHKKYTLARRYIHDAIVGKVGRLDSGLKEAVSCDKVRNSTKKKKKNLAKMPLDENNEKNYYQALKPVLIRGSIPESTKRRLGVDLCVVRPRKKVGTTRPNISNEILQDEVHRFEEELQEWVDAVERRIHREAVRKNSLAKGSSISCACCYDDVAESECVPCKDNGHMFCSECIQQYVESQVFGSGSLGIDRRTKKPATEILCCSGDCTSGFNDFFLKSVLPTKTWEKYCELQHIAVTEQAGLGEEMSSCSKCGFRAHVPETQILFECPVMDCLFISCKKCGKEPHIPLRCEEVVQKEREDEGRLKIEEALSEAKMRTCPKCKQKFIKESGCNKMICRCGLKLCYVCRKPLCNTDPYAHFCQTAHCDHKRCGKCKLHSNTEEDDAQAMREAGITAAEMYKAKIQEEVGSDSAVANINFDVDKIMHDPAARQRRPAPGRQQLPGGGAAAVAR